MKWLIIIGVVAVIIWRIRNHDDGVRDEEDSEEELNTWKSAPRHSVESSRDRRIQFLIENKGQERTIRYHGAYRKVTVMDVYKKRGYDATYLEADSDGEVKSFKFDHITLPGTKWKEAPPPPPAQATYVDNCPNCQGQMTMTEGMAGDITCLHCKAVLTLK